METDSFSIQTGPQNNADINLDKEIIDNIFCPICLKYPEYSIKFSSNSSFSLIHSCQEGKIIRKSFAPKQHAFKCYYCKKNCDKMCIKCKYTICEECYKEHSKANLLQGIQINSDREEVESLFKNIITCQYFCDMHLCKYEDYCPVCKINLCRLCREEHIHINCKKLLAEKVELDDTTEFFNDCYKKLYHLVKILQSCYNKSFINSKMTLNILLNNILAKKIISFIQRKQIPVKGIEIKNDYLNNINKNLYICKAYDNEEFNKYYSNLISNASCGNIRQYYKLNEIRNYYKNDEYLNFSD